VIGLALSLLNLSLISKMGLSLRFSSRATWLSIIKDIGRVIRQLADVSLQGQRMAVLLCEQYYDFAEELADQYVVMERGEVIARGPGSEMKANA